MTMSSVKGRSARVVSSLASALAACLAAGLGACSSSTSSSSSPSGAASQAKWPGFVPLAGLGAGCTAALAAEPANSYGPLTFIPCSSGETNCEELKFDGALTWDPTGSGDLLVFDLEFVHDDQGRSPRLLVRHHYPLGNGNSPNPYEAVLYDLASGAPLAALRNQGTGMAQSSPGTISYSSADCFVVPVASPGGLWLAGSASQGGAVVGGYLAVPGGAGATLAAPSLQPVSVDTSFLQNAALAFDDRLALSQGDGKIVVASTTGAGGAAYGPGQRVWLSGVLGDRFLTVNDKASDGRHYFTLDRSMQFAPYGGKDELSSDGARVAYWQSTSAGVSLYGVSASDGTSGPVQLATIPPPMNVIAPLMTMGTAMGDGLYAVLTYVSPGVVDTGPVTATVANVDTRSVASGQVFSDSQTDSLFPGYRQLFGVAQGYLWFGEVGSVGGFSKVVRVKAPTG
jgi:hypothetical protein